MENLNRYLAILRPVDGLSKNDIIDKIKGCFFGLAIGDALGERTELVSKEECVKA